VQVAPQLAQNREDSALALRLSAPGQRTAWLLLVRARAICVYTQTRIRWNMYIYTYMLNLDIYKSLLFQIGLLHKMMEYIWQYLSELLLWDARLLASTSGKTPFCQFGSISTQVNLAIIDDFSLCVWYMGQWAHLDHCSSRTTCGVQ